MFPDLDKVLLLLGLQAAIFLCRRVDFTMVVLFYTRIHDTTRRLHARYEEYSRGL